MLRMESLECNGIFALSLVFKRALGCFVCILVLANSAPRLRCDPLDGASGHWPRHRHTLLPSAGLV